MDGYFGKLGFLVVVVGGLVWGFSALVGQVREDVAGMKAQAAALVMATDADEVARRGVELAHR